MSLSSIFFVFGIFPVFLIVYYVSRGSVRTCILLATSIVFYYVTEGERIWLLLLIIAFNYVAGLLLEKYSQKSRKSSFLFTLILIADLLPLLYYRYLGYATAELNHYFNLAVHITALDNVKVPLGLSFLTFTMIAYIADIYMGKTHAEKNVMRFSVFVSMFPKIIQGPIIRYADLQDNMEHPVVRVSDAAGGLQRFMIGFCKKTIIANNLADVVAQTAALTNFTNFPVLNLWLGSICFTLEIYYDFSGYSDMAIGIAQMLGYHFKENFNYPYICSSITDFWRRWHISLSTWFRDYIYIPLGGSHCSLVRCIINLLIVWLTTGLWHGAGDNFIAWGLLYFVMIVFERYVVKPKTRSMPMRIAWRFVSLFVINLSWVLFNAPSLTTGINYCFAMFGSQSRVLTDANLFKNIREYGFYILLGILFCFPIYPNAVQYLEQKDRHGILSIIFAVILAGIFIWALSFIMLGVNNPFIYQKF